MLGANKNNYCNEELGYEKDELEDLIADGAQIVGRSVSEKHAVDNAAVDNTDEDDEDFAKIRALYESENPKDVTKKTKIDENEVVEKDSEIFDPSKRVIFTKRKSETGESKIKSISTEKATRSMLSFTEDEDV
jgi:hypothetical protein